MSSTAHATTPALPLSKTSPHLCSYWSSVCKAKPQRWENIQISEIHILKSGRDRKLRIPSNSRACPVPPKPLSSSPFCASLKFPSISPFSPSPFYPSFSLLLPSQAPFGNGVYSCLSCKAACLLWDIPTCAAGRTTSRIQATRSWVYANKAFCQITQLSVAEELKGISSSTEFQYPVSVHSSLHRHTTETVVWILQ